MCIALCNTGSEQISDRNNNKPQTTTIILQIALTFDAWSSLRTDSIRNTSDRTYAVFSNQSLVWPQIWTKDMTEKSEEYEILGKEIKFIRI